MSSVRLNEEDAKRLAEAKLAESASDCGAPLALSHSKRYKHGWLFFYNTVEAIETGDPLNGLAGNWPIYVSENGGLREEFEYYSDH